MLLRTLILVGLVCCWGTSTAKAQRQYFGGWVKASDGRYYCPYLYKSNPQDEAYKKQYVFYHPKDPNWVYWSNPKNNPDNKGNVDSYWARCPTKNHPKFGKQIQQGKDFWSILPPNKRPATFVKLNNGDFPPAKEMSPPIPGSTSGTIPCPPDPPDLPQ